MDFTSHAITDFFAQQDKQGHIWMGLAAACASTLAMLLLGCPWEYLAGFSTAMLLLAGKEVWDANKPLPPGAARNGWREHGLDLLADAIGAVAGLAAAWLLHLLWQLTAEPNTFVHIAAGGL